MAIHQAVFIALCFFSDTCFFSDLFSTLNFSQMKIENLLSKPVWQMTGEELLFLSRQRADTESHTASIKEPSPEKRYVYGIAGICEIFGFSKPTAIRIKKSGRLDKAITQVGRKRPLLSCFLQ